MERIADSLRRAVEDALERIMASADFVESARNRNFLRYVVSETLAGRSGRIKAYSIGTTVFGRDDNFDPQQDAIVRIEAGRLRRALEHYYLTGGQADPLRIDLPRGSYVPKFVPMTPAPTIGRRQDGKLPTILVTAFDEEGDSMSNPGFARGFTRSLIVALTRFTDIRVMGADTALSHSSDVDLAELRQKIDVDYVLTGSCALEADRISMNALLVDARNGRSVWADRLHARPKPSEILDLRGQLADRVASVLAQPYGVIHCDRVRDADGAPPEALGSYQTVLRFYQYTRKFDPDMVDDLRVNLERIIVSEPNFAEAVACLAVLYVDIVRFDHCLTAPTVDPKQRALGLARHAVELAPNSSWARYALGLATWFCEDPDAALPILEQAHQLNPNDSMILGELGGRYVLRGQFERGAPLIEASYAMNPAQPGTYRMGLFIYHYCTGNFAEALSQAKHLSAPHVYRHMAIAAAAASVGDMPTAKAAVSAILALDPDYGQRVGPDLEGRGLTPEITRRLIAGLARAGLPGIETADIPTLENRRSKR